MGIRFITHIAHLDLTDVMVYGTDDQDDDDNDDNMIWCDVDSKSA